jgi:hypothetical protein
MTIHCMSTCFWGLVCGILLRVWWMTIHCMSICFGGLVCGILLWVWWMTIHCMSICFGALVCGKLLWLWWMKNTCFGTPVWGQLTLWSQYRYNRIVSYIVTLYMKLLCLYRLPKIQSTCILFSFYLWYMLVLHVMNFLFQKPIIDIN